MSNSQEKKYWKKNLKYCPFSIENNSPISFVFGILLVDELNTIRLGGFKLGFWFAQQGAIYVFVILIFIYIKLMNKLDKEFGFNER